MIYMPCWLLILMKPEHCFFNLFKLRLFYRLERTRLWSLPSGKLLSPSCVKWSKTRKRCEHLLCSSSSITLKFFLGCAQDEHNACFDKWIVCHSVWRRGRKWRWWRTHCFIDGISGLKFLELEFKSYLMFCNLLYILFRSSVWWHFTFHLRNSSLHL